MIHEILIDSLEFKNIVAGKRTHVLQNYDAAQYSVGDFLALNEITDVEGTEGAIDYTGRCCLVRVTHICTSSEKYLTPGTIILTIRPCIIDWPNYGEVVALHPYTVATYGPGEGEAE